MVLHVRIDGGVAILSGLARLMNDPRYTDAVLDVDDLLDQGHRGFVLELRDVRETGAPMLGVLMTLTRRARQAGGEVVLAHPSRSVRQMLEDMRMDDFWDVFDEVPEAASFLRRGAETIDPAPPDA